jgi:histidine triad (HIT) family protein
MIDKLQVPILMLVTNRKLAGGVDALVRAVAAAVDGGANAVQLREKDLAPAELLPLARRLCEVTAGRALLLVNGPLEIALEAGTDGLHLPEDAPMVERPSPEFVVGRSVHSLEVAQRASDEGVDYVVAGPVYATHSHPEAPAAGVELISRIAGAVPVPVIAIGGITAERADAVVRAGAAGAAVISAVLEAASPREAAHDLRQALGAALLSPAGERGESRSEDCVFCAIVNEKAPASVVYRDEAVVAFMDIQPVNPGHVLVVPVRHTASLTELGDEIAERIAKVSNQIATVLPQTSVACEGFNLFLADGAVAGQEVFHVHMHVIPRYEGDGFGLRFGPHYGELPPRAELDWIADKIRLVGDWPA